MVLTLAFTFCLIGFLLFWRVPLVGRREGAGDLSVSVVIPARNEERNLGRLLASLSCQKPPPTEVIVVDDDSEDETARVAAAAGAVVVSSKPIPDGWTGKPWACWQGAERAEGERLLFLDADTWLEPGALGRIVEAHREQSGLLSIQPYHHMSRAYERLGALFNLITMIGSGAFTIGGSRAAAHTAFGPCVLTTRRDYFQVGGHERSAGAVLEGLPLGRAYFDEGHDVRCLGGRGSLCFRMYPGGLREMIDGLAKGFATGAGSIPRWLLIAVVAWVAGSVSTTRHALGAAFGVEGETTAWLAMAVLYMGQMRWMLSRIGNYGWWPSVLFPIPVAFFIGVFTLSLFRTVVRGRVSWKGRAVSPR